MTELQIDGGLSRVLVLWADPRAENYGLRVLAEGIRILVSSGEAPPPEVVFHSHNTPDSPLTRRMVLADAVRRAGPIVRYLKQFDLIVDTGGGDSFTDIYGPRRLILQAYMHFAARRAKVPIVLAPQTIGPFGACVTSHIGRSVLKHADLVCSRDPESSRYAEQLGRRPDFETSDVAFCLPSVPMAKSHDVILNVSGLLWHPNPHVDFQYYRSSITSLVERLLDDGRSVVLLPHVIGGEGLDNDVPACEAVYDLYRTRGARLVVPKDLTKMREAIGSGAVLIGSRMHACLNAISVGTPAIAWSYSRKFAPLLDAIKYEYHFDLRDEESDLVGKTLALIATDNLDVLAEACTEINGLATGTFAGLEALFRELDGVRESNRGSAL